MDNQNSLVIAGVDISTDDAGRFNLNALHRASGSKKRNGPSYWLALSSSEMLINEINKLTTEISVVRIEGRYGGTFAVEQLAVAYANWISPAFYLQVINTFLDYKKADQHPVIPKTLPEALRLALEVMEERDELKPKAEALDRIATSDGSICITDAAKDLQVRPKDLFQWLSGHQWIYRRAGSAGWKAYQSRLQSGLLEHKVMVVSRGDGSEKTTEQVRVTPKGLVKLSESLNSGHALSA